MSEPNLNPCLQILSLTHTLEAFLVLFIHLPIHAWALHVCLCLPVLQHSFYFYFYFEHLSFTWSYLIDMMISWSLDFLIISLDLISWSTILSWSLDLIIQWWSKIHFFIWTLHYYLHAFDMPLTHVFHWRSTYILHMLLRNMLLPYTWHALNIHFTCVYLEDNTWTLVYNSS